MPVRSASQLSLVLVLFAGLAASCGSSPIEPGPIPGADGPAPIMTKITPTAGPVGTVVTLTGSGFLPRGNHLKFGTGFIKNLDSADGAALRFTIPDGLDLCSPEAGGPCAGGYPQVFPGDYVIAVLGGGDGTRLTFTVTRP